MKEQSASQKRSTFNEVDKRDLVNLDFYDNEILIMRRKLDTVTVRLDTAETKKKIRHLKHELAHQKHNLDEFRKNFDVKEMLLIHQPPTQHKKVKNFHEPNAIKEDENFFLYLQLFEGTFKVIRQEVLEFLVKQE
jgi:hypothetical protein